MYKCPICGRNVEKLIPIDDGYASAQYTELIGIPCPDTNYYCISCAREKLGISDADLIREERSLNQLRNNHFHINALKGGIAQKIIEAIFLEFGYEVYPFGYESYFTNIIKSMSRIGSNKPVFKIRSTPDIVVYDREIGEGFIIEIKATTYNSENYRINKKNLSNYLMFWPETLLMVFCIRTFEIYCSPISHLSESNNQESCFDNGHPCYIINLKRDFHLIHNFFRLIDVETYNEFISEISDTVSLFSP